MSKTAILAQGFSLWTSSGSPFFECLGFPFTSIRGFSTTMAPLLGVLLQGRAEEPFQSSSWDSPRSQPRYEASSGTMPCWANFAQKFQMINLSYDFSVWLILDQLWNLWYLVLPLPLVIFCLYNQNVLGLFPPNNKTYIFSLLQPRPKTNYLPYTANTD